MHIVHLYCTNYFSVGSDVLARFSAPAGILGFPGRLSVVSDFDSGLPSGF